MIYDKMKIVDWSNSETHHKFYGVAARNGRTWDHCRDGDTPILFKTLSAAEDFSSRTAASLKARGLWKEKNPPKDA